MDEAVPRVAESNSAIECAPKNLTARLPVCEEEDREFGEDEQKDGRSSVTICY
uniref:Uncharacterized protein n=1 Tax=Oryza sativa subsp. japonica TaxID=39947 RepID=Q7XB69_ORYSJ|nr:hypothetical protein [Oryza sativa Japonica Group]